MWVPVNRSVFTHRKTMKFADCLDIPEVYAVGHLVALWTWAMDNAPDGVIPEGTSARMIARAAEFPGAAQSFVDALTQAEYLVETDAGLMIPNWDEYGGKLIERQAKDAARKRDGRRKDVSQTSETSPMDNQKSSVGCPQDVRRMSGVDKNTKDKSRVEEIRIESTADAVDNAGATAADPFCEEYKPGKIDLKAILDQRPGWVAWLNQNRPAPKAGQTAEGFDRWKVCQWLNGKEQAPSIAAPLTYNGGLTPEQVQDGLERWRELERTRPQRAAAAAAILAKERAESEALRGNSEALLGNLGGAAAARGGMPQ